MAHKILVIGDYHAHPDYDNERAKLIGRFIARTRPTIVVSMGDWYDMPSLVKHNRGTSLAEGRRICDDLDSGEEAKQFMIDEAGSAYHSAAFVALEGNHEYRLELFAQTHPEMVGSVSVKDTHEALWENIPYGEYFIVDGVAFTHHVTSEMGRAIGGKYAAHKIVSETGMSTVVGHSHKLEYQCVRADKPTGIKKHGLQAGCFGHPDYKEQWCIGGLPHWWRGLCLLNNVEGGQFDPQFYSLEFLQEKFGDV